MRVLITALALFFTSCACWGTAARTRTCAVVRTVVDCTADEVKAVLPSVVPLVEFLLAGANGDPNWEGYLIGLESMGFDIVACAAQVAADSIASHAAVTPDPGVLPRITPPTTVVTANFAIWKAHRADNITIKTTP